MAFGNFDEFFRATFGEDITPFDYQRRLASEPKCEFRADQSPDRLRQNRRRWCWVGCKNPVAAILNLLRNSNERS